MGKVAPQKLQWHGKEYTFTPGVQVYREDTRLDVYMPICGADTESTNLHETGDEKRYEPQCVTYSTPWGDGIEWVATGESAMDKLLQAVLADVPHDAFHKVEFFFYVHNLGYDVPQFFKARPDLMSFARAGVYQAGKIKTEAGKKLSDRTKGGYPVGTVAGRKVYLKDGGLFIGNAPHFTFRCFRNRDDYVDVTFLDSGSFFRGALAKIAEQLALPVEKDERQADIGRRDWRLVSDDHPDKQYFEKYAIKDAVVVKLVGQKIVDLHKEAGFTKIRKSAPAFANAYFMKMVGEQDTILFSGSLDPAINQLVLDAYAGGRTGGIVHGKVENISVYDFASSYPTAMLSLPSFTPTMKYIRLRGRELDWKNVEEILMDYPNSFLRVSGYETDSKYPSLISEKDGRLTPVFGDFTSIATTGPEVLGGTLSGSLHITKVHEAVFLVDTEPVDSPFARFATEAYEMKKREEKDTIPYLMAKLLLNSAYGKWIQSTKAQYVGTDAEDFTCMLPTGYEPEYARLYLETYAEVHMNGADVWEALEGVTAVAIQHMQEESIGGEDVGFRDLDLSEKEFAPSAIPAAAALVTGIARARLRALMKATNAKYWDTDSVFIDDMPAEEFEKCLQLGTSWIHPDLAPLEMGNELGNIDKEMDRGSGYLAGTKRYYLEERPKVTKVWVDFDDVAGERVFVDRKKQKRKTATHGLVGLDKHNMEKVKAAIRDLATGSSHKYRTKESPLKAKQTSDKEVGRFVAKDVVAKFNLDPRIEWENKGIYFEGRMREWEWLDVPDYDPRQDEKEWSLTYKLKEMGVRRPLKGDAFYREWMRLSDSCKRVFRPGKERAAMSLDEAAMSLGKTVDEILEAIY